MQPIVDPTQVDHAASAPEAQAPPVQEMPQAPPVHEAPPAEVSQAPPAEQQAPPMEVQQAPEPQAPAAEPQPVQPAAASGGIPSQSELSAAWQPLLESMSGRVRSRFSAGHFMPSGADTANFGLPNPVHRDRCEEIRAEVDAAIASHFGRPIPLALVVDETEPEPDFFNPPPSGGAVAVAEPEPTVSAEEDVDVHSLVDATGDVPSAEDRVLATFEGSTVLEDPPTPHT